jgi:exosortase
VQNLATSPTTTDASPERERHFSTPLALSVLFLAALWFILYVQLSGEWLVNEQYNYGWFVPFFAIYLFWLRWQDRPEPEVRSQKSEINGNRRALITGLLAVSALFLLLPVRLFEIANPDWRLLAWVHTGSVVTLTLLYLWCVGGGPWLRHFAFPVAFIFVAVPWVTPIEGPIIQGLMRAVAAVAAETVTLFGIPAQLEGNLIRVTNGLVGVNEACSGVRSLQTALMIGLLLGELKRLSISRRFVLVAGAIALALVANFLRAFFLVWIAATENISEVSRWHGLAGYAIIGLVFAGTLLLAALLGGKGRGRRAGEQEGRGQPPSVAAATYGEPGRSEIRGQRSEVSLPRRSLARRRVVSSPFLAAALCWIMAVEAGAQLWYRAHERNLISATRWDVRWPETAPDFRQLKIDEEVRRVLRFDEGQAAAWMIPAATSLGTLSQSKPNTVACLLYLFRWKPGRNSALLANLHRPDVCLPAVGWIQVADNGVRDYRVSASFALPFRHFEFRRGIPGNSTQETAHAFYCLSEDRAVGASASGSELPQMSGSRSSWTRVERIRTVLEGRRHLGQQVMEFVILSRIPIDLDQVEARFAQALPELIKVEDKNGH